MGSGRKGTTGYRVNHCKTGFCSQWNGNPLEGLHRGVTGCNEYFKTVQANSKMTALLYGKSTVWRQSRSRRTGKRLLWFSRANAVLFDSRLSWWTWWDRITLWGSGSISKVEMKGLADRFHVASKERVVVDSMLPGLILSLSMNASIHPSSLSSPSVSLVHSNSPCGLWEHGVQKPQIYTLSFSNPGSFLHIYTSDLSQVPFGSWAQALDQSPLSGKWDTMVGQAWNTHLSILWPEQQSLLLELGT